MNKYLFDSTDIKKCSSAYIVIISHGRTRQSNPFNLKTPLCRTSTFKASFFNRITKLWNFVCSLKSPSSFSSKQSFKQFVYKTMFTNLVNTYEVERSILLVDISDNLFLSHVEVTVPTTFLFTFVGNVHLGFELFFFKGK